MSSRGLLILSLSMFSFLSPSVASQAAQMECEYAADAPIPQPQTPIDRVSLEFREDSRPVIALTAGPMNEQSLHLTDCRDLECGLGTERLLDSAFNYSSQPGLAVRSSGRPMLAAVWYGGLNVYDCGDAGCSFRSVRPLIPTSLGATGGVLALMPDDRAVIGSEGNGIQGNPFDLVGYRCADAACSSAQAQTLQDYPDNANHTLLDFRLAASAEGDLYVSWIRMPGPANQTEWQLLRCPGGDCSAAMPSLVSGATAISYPVQIVMAIRADGRPLLLDGQSGRRVLIDCTDADCASFVPHPLPVPSTGLAGGLALDEGGRVNFFHFESGELSFHTCRDAICSESDAVQVALPVDTIWNWSFGKAPDGRLGLAYVTAGTRQARLASCGDGRLFNSGFESF